MHCAACAYIEAADEHSCWSMVGEVVVWWDSRRWTVAGDADSACPSTERNAAGVDAGWKPLARMMLIGTDVPW